MLIAPLPDNESQRIEALHRYAVLDTDPEQAFDDLAQLASHICGTPIALVSFVDANRQWFKSTVGITVRETSRDLALCAHAIHQADLFIVPDAAHDSRFADNPLVTGDPHICFYAGMPLMTSMGEALGTLCVMDRVPRELTPSQQDALRRLGRQVVRLLELRNYVHERHRVVEALCQNEARFELVARGSQDALWDWNILTNEVYLSPRWKQMRGYEEHELSNRLEEWSSRIHPDDKDRIMQSTEAYLARRTSHFQEEYRTRCKDGTYKWILDRGQTVWDDQGLPVRMAGSESDITERKAEADRVAASERHLRDVLDSLLLFVGLFTPEGVFLEANRLPFEAAGLTREDAIGKCYRDTYWASDLPEAWPIVQDALARAARGEIVRTEVPVRIAPDRVLTMDAFFNAIYDQDGRVLKIVGSGIDVTERKQAEERTQASQLLLDAIIDNLPAMVFLKDAANLRFVRWNKAAEELVGYSRDELIGKSDYDIFPKEEAGYFTAKDRETLSGGILVDIPEEPIQTKTKGPRLLHTRKIPICDSTGTPQYLLGISEDITERKEDEAAFLAACVAAEEASQAKSDFLATMSHEMRTPLNAIIGLTDFLLRTPLSPEQADLLKRCEKAGVGLLRMIEDILQAAKIASRTVELVHEPFVLRELVTDTINLVSSKAQDKGLFLSLRIDPGLPALVMGDALRLQEVLLNLIGNAVKFTAKGGVEVRVRPVPGEADAGAVQFEVADTGIGIPSELHDKIFERFWQADSGGSRAYGGVGLGLSICQQLIGLMGGRILVESTPGCGSTFTVIARFAVMPEEGWPPLESCRVAVPSTATGAGPLVREKAGLKILLAEDCVESQELMALYLSGTPHTMDCADNGNSVVERYKTGQYNLVFMDLQMPGMDGYAAARAIRDWEEVHGLPPIPIVALTASVDGDVQRKCLLAGCTGFVPKPVREATIVGVIQRFMVAPAEGGASGRGESRFVSKGETVERKIQALLPEFVRNRGQDVTTLQSAIMAQNVDLIRTIGHRIKGLSGSYGLETIGMIGSAIEQAALDHDFERVTLEVQRLVQALREVAETSR